ncbi:type II secretion system F family protein [Frigidibacter albus]|uniref:Type II secretion system F family protein n=1 Tax=Frigidibacter albus TaxID=1465486 RepID=A0A6L8VI41_9RHOB|nr:type II secretion system F family protein [Frigidibacter albus]MZQ89356.1 type II secretion system F family protein [Frigidibacter albus]NBE31262.1 type II secretion system F family protein [Frigidibacter albus]GGH53769.1 pilus assembly protein TadC [Frigidibacter albus]
MQLFTDLNAALIANLGPLGPLYAVGGLGLLLILAVLPMMMRKTPDPLEKLRQSNQAAQAAARAKEPTRKMLRSGKTDKLEKFAGFLEPQNEEEMTSARLKLTRAGYRGKSAVRTFHAAQFVLGIGLLVLGVIYAFIKSKTGDLSTTNMILYALGPGIAGYYLPRYWVDKRVESRQKEMQNGFPDALDMLLVCVEAGQSVDQAIVRVAKELEPGFPALSEEFELVAYEVKAGKEKATVLRGFAERAGLPDISSFVTVLIQSQTFGTSIAEALRVYAADMRDKRVMRAEELANKLPTKITLGTMMFTVPPLLIILVGPSVHSMLGLFDSMR